MIHGDLPQTQREKIMAGFRTGKIKYLIATDVVSRGIDVNGISHVINYDLPMDIENYVHRIGRTGRIGRDGIAISFVTPEQGGQLTDIEMMINKLIDRDGHRGLRVAHPPRAAGRPRPGAVGGRQRGPDRGEPRRRSRRPPRRRPSTASPVAGIVSGCKAKKEWPQMNTDGHR